MSNIHSWTLRAVRGNCLRKMSSGAEIEARITEMGHVLPIPSAPKVREFENFTLDTDDNALPDLNDCF